MKLTSSESFSGGGMFDLPPGLWAMTFDVRLHQNTKGDGTKGMQRLGVMAHCVPTTPQGEFDSTREVHDYFMSLGPKAQKSFMPSDDGKDLKPIPGAPAGGMGAFTAWQMFQKSLVDCGLPKEQQETDGVGYLDGIWVITDNIPAPEQRNSFKKVASTSAAAQQETEEPKGSDKVMVAIEIVAAPWRDEGGMPEEPEEEAPKPVVKKAGVKAPAASAKPTTKAALPKAKTPPPPVEEESEGTTLEITQAAAADALTAAQKEKKTLSKIQLRMQVNSRISAKHSEDVASAAVDEHFASDDALNAMLGDLGYQLKGNSIVAQ